MMRTPRLQVDAALSKKLKDHRPQPAALEISSRRTP